MPRQSTQKMIYGSGIMDVVRPHIKRGITQLLDTGVKFIPQGVDKGSQLINKYTPEKYRGISQAVTSVLSPFAQKGLVSAREAIRRRFGVGVRKVQILEDPTMNKKMRKETPDLLDAMKLEVRKSRIIQPKLPSRKVTMKENKKKKSKKSPKVSEKVLREMIGKMIRKMMVTQQKKNKHGGVIGFIPRLPGGAIKNPKPLDKIFALN